MRTHLHDLFAGSRLDGAHSEIRAAESDQFAVGRPANAIKGVVTRRGRNRKLAFGDVPNLDLTEARRVTAGNGEPLAIWRETQRLHPLGEADEPSHQVFSVVLVQQNLVQSRDRE